MKCTELAAQLTDFIDGNLMPDVQAAALEHLATCTQCETVLAGTRALMGVAVQHGKFQLSSRERQTIINRVLPRAATGK